MRLDSSELLKALFNSINRISADIKDPMAKKVFQIIKRGEYELLSKRRDLLVYMYINKVLGLLLLQERSSYNKLRAFIEKISQQRRNFLMHLEDIIQLLNKCDVRFVIYKTLRPVPDTPVDIDVLVESDREIPRALNCLKRRFNIEIWGIDRYSIGIRIPELKEFIDLYVKPHIADLVYMDSNFIIRNVTHLYVKEFDIDMMVPVPSPEVEFCNILAHSIIKERLITLNDILSLFSYENISKKDQILKFISESSLNISYAIFLDILDRSLPAKISYKERIQTLAPLMRRSYTLESLPYFIAGVYKRVRRIVEYDKRVSYMRGFNR
jgi:hypothetical protein